MSSTSCGIATLIVAGVTNASFTMPMKYARKWAWENTWLAWTVFALVVPQQHRRVCGAWLNCSHPIGRDALCRRRKDARETERAVQFRTKTDLAGAAACDSVRSLRIAHEFRSRFRDTVD
jgi:hypothetical protein